MNIRQQLKQVMEILADLDLTDVFERNKSQKKLNKAYNILDSIDAELEREDIRNKQGEETND